MIKRFEEENLLGTLSHVRHLHNWGMDKASVLKYENFVASPRFITNLKKINNLVSKKSNKVILPLEKNVRQRV